MKPLYINISEIIKGLKTRTNVGEETGVPISQDIHSKLSKILVQRFYFNIYRKVLNVYKKNTDD
jgi:hypothetical protein